MNNFLSKGDTVTVPAPYAVTSGAGVLVGAIFGVAAYSAALGVDVEIKREGVYSLTTLSTDTATIGARLYWDNTNKRATTTSAGNTLIGAAAATKAAGTTVCAVLLDGVIR